MEIINLVLDFVLIAMSIWMLTIVTGYGGDIGRAFTVIGWGAFILGIAHLVETITFEVFGLSQFAVELSHRLIVIVGFALVVIGFQMFVQKK